MIPSLPLSSPHNRGLPKITSHMRNLIRTRFRQ
jgi:hypothetical protein